MNDRPDIDAVRSFWESNPLWTGESGAQEGSREFFDEHRRVYVEDCFAGELDPRTLPTTDPDAPILDLGCGPGFWTETFLQLGFRDVTAADLTEHALELVRQRCAWSDIKPTIARENAESLTFDDCSFSHVNCQGVIHHTPHPERAVAEIARVLKPGGTAVISVYYLHPLLRVWPVFRWAGKAAAALGVGLRGRGRERMLAVDDARELVRLYDGADNPIGIAYSRKEFLTLLEPWFDEPEIFLHFFPARAFPIPLPRSVHRLLDRHSGLMIFARATRKGD